MARVDLVGERKLFDCGLVLVRMASPGAIHQTACFVLFIFGQNSNGPVVKFGVGSAWKQRSHAADGKRAVTVAGIRKQLSKVLKEWNIMWNRVAVRQYPSPVVQVEVYKAG